MKNLKKIENYRPGKIKFLIEDETVPKSLGKFKDGDEVRAFVGTNLLAMQSKLKTMRYMDEYEIQQLRNECSVELEENLPELQNKLGKAKLALEQAKQSVKDAEELYNAKLTEIKTLAGKAKRGTTEMTLDQLFTWEVVYNGKRYYFTYVDNELQLADVLPLDLMEQDDLISTSEKNKEYFEKLKSESA